MTDWTDDYAEIGQLVAEAEGKLVRPPEEPLSTLEIVAHFGLACLGAAELSPGHPGLPVCTVAPEVDWLSERLGGE